MAPHLLGYARVSTLDQSPQLQLDALEAAGCHRIWTDSVSGTRADRPQLEALMDHLRKGDTLVVWRLDRLGRSLQHLLKIIEDLQGRGVGFRSITEAIDTTTAGGRLVFSVFGAIAQFEAELIRERTTAGLEAAKAQGRVGGRPSVMNADKLAAARALLSEGATLQEAANAIAVSRSTLRRHLRLTG